jgi:histidinol dehydrogenase
MIRRLKTAKPEVERAEDDAKVRATVEAALADIASRGDVAVREMSQKFDGHSPEAFQLSEREIESALSQPNCSYQNLFAESFASVSQSPGSLKIGKYRAQVPNN